ncbi:MAG: todS 3 [Planctomycetaceae bacterium]|nr:todS 3 [Planctomycetaceae bacterium]
MTSAAEKRVLFLPPTRKDGEVTCKLLAIAGISCDVCESLSQLSQQLAEGCGAVLLTETALTGDGIHEFLNHLEQQPAWSDIPVVMMVPGGAHSTTAINVIESLRNVTLVDRPAPMRSLVSAVHAAVRGRGRQYQIRDQIAAISRAEARARGLQEQLEIALDASELGTFHCPMPLGEIIWNQRCKAHFFLPPEAKIDFDLFYDRLHPDDRERTRQAVQACVFADQVYDIEYRVVAPEGEIRWVRATGRTYYNMDNEPVCFDGTTQDITARKASEAALQETQERFQALANLIPQLAWIAKPDGKAAWYNQRWYEYTGKTFDEMATLDAASVHDPRELPRIKQKLQDAFRSGQPWEDTFPLRRHDGEFRWHLSRAMPFRDGHNDIILWFGTNTDITEERQRGEERQLLLESERAARKEAERVSLMKDEFLATLSHELRTPLNVIFGWTQLLKLGRNDPETLAEGINVIDRNVRLQTKLIEDLLDVSRIISGKIRLEVQSVDLPEIIAATIEGLHPAADAKDIRLEANIDSATAAVNGDPGRLQQVLWNLLNNAIKFTPKEGHIQVVARQVDSSWEVRVIDSGEGISPEFLPHLFERFSQADGSTTRQHGGLGLGLSIVKHLIELHGGTVRAESLGQGRGSTFVISLPIKIERKSDPYLSQIKLPLPDSATNHQPMKLPGIKVLVVDDEPDARELMRRCLLASDVVPQLASSAEEAQDVLTRFTPDVILSDIGMPSQDGYEFMRALRRQGNQTPAVALTAFARPEDHIRSIQAGFQTHLPKPVEPAELLAVIAGLTGRFDKT